MLHFIFRILTKFILSLRYVITYTGHKAIKSKRNTGMLFLPNHPALIDPVIVISHLYKWFKARPTIAEDQLDNRLVKKIASQVNPIVIPDLSISRNRGAESIDKAIDEIISALKSGDNVVVYPAGRIYRSKHEEIGAKSAVDKIIKALPELEVVLVRTTGLWGSSFSRATGKLPHPTKNWKKYLFSLLINGIFFGPRRKVKVELALAENFPFEKDKLEINKYLEKFYNKTAAPNTFVPYTWWQGFSSKKLPEPQDKIIHNDISHVPADIQEQVIGYVKELAGISKVSPEQSLAKDLGLDSLASLEIMSWLEQEFGMPQGDMEALQSVSDCILAANGESIGKKRVDTKPVPKAWYKIEYKDSLKVAEGKNIAEVFLNQAKKNPKAVLIADQLSGAKTNRDIVLAIFVLKSEFEKIPGERIGIMLPSAVSAGIIYLAAMFAGKTPVMVNWTVGKSNMEYSLNSAGVTHVLTAKALVDKLKTQGFDYSEIDTNWVILEDYAKKISTGAKIKALLKSRFSWRSLYKAKISENAVVLFTSGSEANPKSVPLTHENILTNLKDLLHVFDLKPDYKLLGMLPPFHSLGLVVTLILPLCSGLKTVYHANPTEASTLAKLVDMYKASLLIGTPTFINGIMRAAIKEQLSSVRLAITGAEKCPDYVYAELNKMCPEAVICEGYGITECSPVVSVNHMEDTEAGTIGHVVPSVEYVIVNSETGDKTKPGEQGKLYVKGKSIFSGYLDKEAKSPFVEYDNQIWYDTGDLVKESEKGILTFCGRLKRFIKLGGEMVSLPAIEEALLKHVKTDTDEGPVIAVESTPVETNPEIVLFSTIKITREEVNNYIREEGLSGLHNIRKIVDVDEIPILGTGKTDYKVLKASLK